jgi:hypothetical protein
MTTRRILKAAVAAVALILLAQTAFGQSVTLRLKAEPGDRRLYERTVRTEMMLQSGEQSRRTVTEVPGQRRELVLETKADPPSMRVAGVDAPQGRRLLAFEENGKDRLSSVPEAERTQALPQGLFSQWRDLRGQLIEKPAKPADPGQAMDMIQAEVRFPPEQPVKQGDSWTRDLDLGPAKATLTTRFTATRTEGTRNCAILETSANVTFTGDFAARVKVEKLTSRMAWALDGSGWVTQTGSMVVVEKREKAEQRITRDFQEKLTDADRVDPAQLEKARKDFATIDKGFKEAQANDLDAALETLGAFVRENPQGPWTPAIQNIYANLSSQKLVTKPVAAPRLRLMLRDLQTGRDQASAQGNAAQINQIDQTLRQVAGVNLKTVLEDSKDPDPVVRDLAAFGLTFAQDAEAANRLLALASDESSQVRGTAVIGLAIQAKGIEQNRLLELLKDKDARVQGAAGLLATRTLKREDLRAATVIPILIEDLKSANAWTRLQMVSGLANLAPLGSVPAAKALVEGYKAEKEERLRPIYLAALKALTGVEAKDLAPYEAWMQNPTTPPAPKPETPAPKAETPAPKAETPAPKAETPTPKAETPAPKAETPAPKAETPAPKAETPAPKADTPAPKAETPAPKAETPAPKAETPAPKAETPAPKAETPTPKAETPTPKAETPAPKPK